MFLEFSLSLLIWADFRNYIQTLFANCRCFS